MNVKRVLVTFRVQRQALVRQTPQVLSATPWSYLISNDHQ
jgi:hypothetical protein